MSDDLPAKRLTAHDVERVLRRAIELQHAGELERDPAYTVADVERVGAEIGVDSGTIKTALVQVEHEKLVRAREQPGWIDRSFGAAWVIAARTVPGPSVEVHAATAAMLQGQLYRVARNLGHTLLWEPGTGWLHGVRRALDFSQKYRLSADSIVVTITDSLSEPGWSDVRIEASLGETRSSALRRAVVGPFAFSGMTTAIALSLGAASVAFAPLLLAAMLGGGALVMRSRRDYREQLQALQQGLDRFLDYLERERVR